MRAPLIQLVLSLTAFAYTLSGDVKTGLVLFVGALVVWALRPDRKL